MKIILRFDDICPTMNHSVWAELSEFLIDQRLQPILAIVPDNKDPKLMVDIVDSQFWEKISFYQALNWTIALHGNTHELVDCAGSNVFFTKLTEFTNLDYKAQYNKIKDGLDTFNQHGISCDMFVAPAHSFNDLTMLALKETNIKFISDGMSLYPFKNKLTNIVQVPQQLWSFRRPLIGIWTICLHHNQWDQGKIDAFKAFVIMNRKYMHSVTSIEVKENFIIWSSNLLFGIFARVVFFVKGLL